MLTYEWWRSLFRLAPAQRDYFPAGRIMLGTAVPLLLLWWLKRPDLTIYVSFATFTGIYARHEPTRSRFRHQLTSAFLLLACESLGWALSQNHASVWTITLAGSVVAFVGAVLAAALGLRPAGAVFFLFAVTAIAGIPAPPPFAQALGVGLGTAAFCVLLGWLGGRLSEHVRPGELTLPPPNPLSEEELSWHGLRHAVGVALAGALGNLSPFGHSYWGMVAAIAPISVQALAGRVERGMHRVVGTLGGVVLTALLSWLPASSLSFTLIVCLMSFLSEWLVARNYSVALFFVTPLALFTSQLAHPSPIAPLLLSRLAETVIGAVIGIAVVVFVRSPEERQADPWPWERRN